MINHKTYYTVDFKTEDLIQRAVIAQNNHLRVSEINCTFLKKVEWILH